MLYVTEQICKIRLTDRCVLCESRRIWTHQVWTLDLKFTTTSFSIPLPHTSGIGFWISTPWTLALYGKESHNLTIHPNEHVGHRNLAQIKVWFLSNFPSLFRKTFANFIATRGGFFIYDFFNSLHTLTNGWILKISWLYLVTLLWIVPQNVLVQTIRRSHPDVNKLCIAE